MPQTTAAAPPRAGRLLCPRCTRPLAACLCTWVRATANQVPLVVLQHPQEARQAKASARMLQLSLGRCRCVPGASFSDAVLASLLDTGDASTQALLLYPADSTLPEPVNAVPPLPALPLQQPDRWRLVLLDGTWRQSRQMLRAHPRLQALPRWPLPAPPPSRYAIRRAHRREQLSTLEAACLALGALEGDSGRYAPLLAAFDGWVAAVAARMPAPRRNAADQT